MSQAESVFKTMSAIDSELKQAVEITATVSKVGFDWPNVEGVISKIHEELDEVKHEINTQGSSECLHDEVGDLLFAVCNLARHLKVDPQQALTGTNQKFIRRFSHIEKQVFQLNKTLTDCSLSELDQFWDEAKQLEKQP